MINSYIIPAYTFIIQVTLWDIERLPRRLKRKCLQTDVYNSVQRNQNINVKSNIMFMYRKAPTYPIMIVQRANSLKLKYSRESFLNKPRDSIN